MRMSLWALALLFAPSLFAQRAPVSAEPDTTEALLTPTSLHSWIRTSTDDRLGFEGLPLRTVEEVAALLPGVYRDFADGSVRLRASGGTPALDSNRWPYRARLGQAPVVMVDGIRLASSLAVPFEAVERVDVLTGFVPASYGEGATGLVVVETREGTDAFGASAEALTSEFLDPYGYSRAAFSLGGPLGRAETGHFFLSGDFGRLDDAMPYGVETFRLTDEAYAALRDQPQVVQIVNGSGASQFVPFPWEAAQAAAANGTPLTVEQLADLIDLPAGFSIADEGALVSAPQTYTEERFERVRAQPNPLRALAFQGGTVVHPSSATTLRLGGSFEQRNAEQTGPPLVRFTNGLYNRDHLYNRDQDAWHVYGAMEQRLTAASSFRLHADYQRWSMVEYPQGFSDDVADALAYGDIDGEAGDLARRYFVQGAEGYFPIYTQDGGSGPASVLPNLFTLPGQPATRYQRSAGSAFRFAGSAQTRLGLHHITFGGEFEQRTYRLFVLDGLSLARFADDRVFDAEGNVIPGTGLDQVVQGLPTDADGNPIGVAAYEELPFEAFRVRAFYYGYGFNGLDEVGGESIDDYFDVVDPATGARGNTDVAPYRPLYSAGFVQDRVTWRSVTVDVGLRVEAFDANASGLRDDYATVPLVRAADLEATPAGIGGDFAVYFNDVGATVGYRDLDGQFYDANGEPVAATVVTESLSGQTQRDLEASPSAAFADTPVHVVWEPRVGAAVQASEQVRVFGHYSRLAQRSPVALYTPFRSYEEISVNLVGNANLAPEVVDAFGVGVSFQPRPAVTFTSAVFLRHHQDRIVQRRLDGGFPSYQTYLNDGSLTEYGVDLAATLARSRGLAARAAYTLAFANGTDMDREAIATLPTDLTASADFDTRHALDLVIDYRTSETSGPLFARGWGLGAVFSAQSGLPYTALASGTQGSGGINETRLPWIAQLDLRLNKRLRLGSSTVTAFLWIENVLGTTNVLAVYRATGEPDQDSFLGSPAGQAFLDAQADRAAAAFNSEAFTAGSVNVGGSQTTRNPFVYGQPRQIRFGLRLGF